MLLADLYALVDVRTFSNQLQ